MTTDGYKLTIWGARGTVPTPAQGMLRFGGNTSCLAVELNESEHIVLDCGSGVRLLGNSLKAQTDRERRFHIFFTHYHFDHVEGLPLFQPIYDPNSRITFHGFESGGRPVGEILESLIRPPYFPVTFADVPATVDYRGVDGTPVEIGDVTVSSLPLNHPDGCLSFRLERGDRRIVYATDHEHGDEPTDKALVEFSRGADCLIYDATYMRAEYESLRKGWGHSTWYAAVRTAMAAGVGKLLLFHHHPEHSDDDLEKVLAISQQEYPATEIAREGMQLPL
jgi:phosphoribosyl 1,2-cyclic phosphodiesterase